ncbi:MAG: hypothetical protein ABI876_13085, partial [Bacteroidota bacterium]
PISPIAWIPIAILWFGVENLTAVFLIFIASTLPVIVAVTSAVHHIPAVHLRMRAVYRNIPPFTPRTRRRMPSRRYVCAERLTINRSPNISIP